MSVCVPVCMHVHALGLTSGGGGTQIALEVKYHVFHLNIRWVRAQSDIINQPVNVSQGLVYYEVLWNT